MNGLYEYDFSARRMDNAGTGFTTPDPLAELHYSESPYSYCGANPVNRVDPTGLAYFAGDGGAIWREGDNNDTWTDPRTHQKYSNIGDYYTFRTSGGTQTDYKGKFDSFVDDPAPDSKNYSFFNYGSMNGAKDNTGVANNSTTGGENDQNGGSGGNKRSIKTSDPEHTNVFDGILGKVRYIVFGPNEGNSRYDINGKRLGGALTMGMPPDVGFANEAKVLQTGGHILKSSTLEALNITKEEGKFGIEAMKKANGLCPDFHGKIMSNGDFYSKAGQFIDNILDYIP